MALTTPHPLITCNYNIILILSTSVCTYSSNNMNTLLTACGPLLARTEARRWNDRRGQAQGRQTPSRRWLSIHIIVLSQSHPLGNARKRWRKRVNTHTTSIPRSRGVLQQKTATTHHTPLESQNGETTISSGIAINQYSGRHACQSFVSHTYDRLACDT